MTTYDEFLAAKAQLANAGGFEPNDLPGHLFDFQRLLVEWAAQHGGAYRIVLCGFDDEHDELLAHGWRKEIGRAGGGAGYNTDGRAGRRERLWLSPTCVETNLALDFTEEVSP